MAEKSRGTSERKAQYDDVDTGYFYGFAQVSDLARGSETCAEPCVQSAIPFPRIIPAALVRTLASDAMDGFQKDIKALFAAQGAPVREVSVDWDGINRKENRAIVRVAYPEKRREAVAKMALWMSLDRPGVSRFLDIVNRYFPAAERLQEASEKPPLQGLQNARLHFTY